VTIIAGGRAEERVSIPLTANKKGKGRGENPRREGGLADPNLGGGGEVFISILWEVAKRVSGGKVGRMITWLVQEGEKGKNLNATALDQLKDRVKSRGLRGALLLGIGGPHEVGRKKGREEGFNVFKNQ